MTNQTNDIDYIDFLTDNEIYQYECDMEEGDYMHWIEKYPTYTRTIFASVLYFYNDLNNLDIQFFINKGLDLNTTLPIINTTALCFACEYRNIELMKSLINNEADVNVADNNGNMPLELVLMGHNPYYLRKIADCEDAIKILIDSNVKMIIRKFVLDEFCQYYIESLYLKQFLKKCTLN